ncbi:MAG: hypothetical protein IPO07_20560 [Haliscomenobacter sp.]|nr:hypothetical protein [Haliscomenobacter sp.]MBK9490907.1 hypothetical protein [Haliscomenobacter sp.]
MHTCPSACTAGNACVGAALRLAPHHWHGQPRAWMTRGNLSEAGFYAAVKISPWPKNMSTGGKGGNGKKKGGKGMDCYDF